MSRADIKIKLKNKYVVIRNKYFLKLCHSVMRSSSKGGEEGTLSHTQITSAIATNPSTIIFHGCTFIGMSWKVIH